MPGEQSDLRFIEGIATKNNAGEQITTAEVERLLTLVSPTLHQKQPAIIWTAILYPPTDEA